MRMAPRWAVWEVQQAVPAGATGEPWSPSLPQTLGLPARHRSQQSRLRRDGASTSAETARSWWERPPRAQLVRRSAAVLERYLCRDRATVRDHGIPKSRLARQGTP
jgi:hypothetical protein